MGVAAAIGAGVGALAGSMKDEASQTSTSGVRLAPQSELERLGLKTSEDQLKQLTGFTAAGPGQGDVARGVSSQRDLASMLEAYSKGGFLPSQADFSTAGQFAQGAFAPQQTAINQQFQQEQIRANQLAAQLGRPANDPIIQARLSQERQQAQERLGAAQSAYTSDFALSLPQQRLGYAAQLSDVRSSLASQAMANRQALLSMGSSLAENERTWRLNTAERYNQQNTSSGGGLKGALMGGLAGAGMGAKIGSMFGPSSPTATDMSSARDWSGYAVEGQQVPQQSAPRAMPAAAPSFAPMAIQPSRTTSHLIGQPAPPAMTFGNRGGFGMPMDYGTSVPSGVPQGSRQFTAYSPYSPYPR